MIPHAPVDFAFDRDWIHAGVTYQRGDRAQLAPATADLLTRAGAGRLVSPHKPKRRSVDNAGGLTTDTDLDSGV